MEWLVKEMLTIFKNRRNVNSPGQDNGTWLHNLVIAWSSSRSNHARRFLSVTNIKLLWCAGGILIRSKYVVKTSFAVTQHARL
jgi:hypothetical protein